MKIKNSIIIVLLTTITLSAQKMVTIKEVNEIVLSNSNAIKIIDNNFAKDKIESGFYRISLFPKVSTSISFPYQRSISEVIQQDGSQRFIERNFLNPVINLTISQVVPFTGGNLSVTSSLNNNRDFNNKTSSYSSNWANISYQQTINGFNSYKWNKKLNYFNIKKYSINNLKEKIKLKYTVNKLYLDTQLIQLKLDLLRANIDKTEKIAIELDEKFKLGRTIKIEVEQTKITLEELKNQLVLNELQYISGIKALKNIMNDQSESIFKLKSVEEIDYMINIDMLKQAIKKNGFDLDKTIKLLESDSNIEKVKKEGAVSFNLQLGMGLNSSANSLSNLYETPSQSQFATIGTKIPILDWGKSKKNYELALLEKENVELTINENEKKIDEQVEDLSNYKLSLTAQVKSLKQQLKLSKAINEMFDELLILGRKTISEYKTQLIEVFNVNIEYQKSVNNLYLLKLKIDEINLTL
jgi:outer membrane protein